MVIYQPLSGYCYNSDTIFLYDFIKDFKIFGDVLDIGAGSGILALLVKRDFDVNASAVEMQEEFAKYIKINSTANKADIHLYYGNFLDIKFDKKFDFIISNPPFYHKGVIRSKDKRVDIARYSGYLPIEEFFKKVNRLLKPKGSFIFCYDAKQIQDILYFLRYFKINVEYMKFIHPKRDKEASLVLIYAKKSSKSLTKILPPLIVFKDGVYTKEVNEIFKRVGVHSIKCKI